MKQKLNSKPLTAILLVVLFGIIGGTIAYYQSSDTFTNEFDAGKYVIKTEEKFESPTNWLPGDTTPKEITVTNQGNVDAAVKVCLNPKWEDENGNTLPLYDNNYEFAAQIEFNSDFDLYWLNQCDNNFEDKYCFYYNKKLTPGETTEPLLESVTYNPNFEFNGTTTCTTDPTTHKKTCTTTLGGYSGGKYTLTANIETVQYSEYQNIWSGVEVQKNNGACGPLRVLNINSYHNLLRRNDNYHNFFGKEEYSDKLFDVEKLKIMTHKNVPNNAIDSWDMSYLNDGSVMLWIMDEDNDGMYEIYIGADGKVVANPNSTSAFSQLGSIEEIDLTNLDTSQVTNMSAMFYMTGSNSSTLTFIGLDTWDTSNVTNMEGMFKNVGQYSTSWTMTDISNWDVSNVETMEQMFAYSGAPNLTIDFSNWDADNAYKCSMFFDSRLTKIGTDHWAVTC